MRMVSMIEGVSMVGANEDSVSMWRVQGDSTGHGKSESRLER